MKKLFLIGALVCVFHSQAFAQQNGALLPALPPVFTGPGAGPAANGKLCTTATGTNTSLATYSDAALTTPLPNPITLNALGIPQTGGGASTAIYIQPLVYRVTLYAAGRGNTCNGTTVGAQIWRRDNIYDIGLLLKQSAQVQVKNCANYSGATGGAKIAACIADLPVSGGIADARGLDGSQDITATISIAKPVTLMLGDATYTSSSNPAFEITSAANVVGTGIGVSVFQQADTTSNVFNIASTAAFSLRGVTIQSKSHQTSGAAVVVTGDGANSNQISVIENNTFSGQRIAVDLGQVAGVRIIGNQFQDIRLHGVRLNNGVNGDQGDNYISLNAFAGPDPYTSGTAAIELVAGGGLMVDNNKFFTEDVGVKVAWNTTADSSQLSIQNNNFEAMTTGGQAILLSQVSGTLGGVSISNNYYNATNTNCGDFMDVPANGAIWSSQWVVSNNNIILGNCGIAFKVVGFAGAQAIYIGNHVFGNAGTSQAFSLGANLASLRVWGNTNFGVGVDDVFTSGLRGNYEQDNIAVGVPNAIALTDPFSVLNNKAYVSRNHANTQWNKLIYQDTSDNVTIAADNQPVVTGTGSFTTQGAFNAASIASAAAVTGATFTANLYKTGTNCQTGSSTPACGGASAGTVAMPAGGTTLTVATTAVTATSEIFVRVDTAKNVGVTCNTGAALSQTYWVDTITAGVSFRISTTPAPMTDPACLDFLIVN